MACCTRAKAPENHRRGQHRNRNQQPVREEEKEGVAGRGRITQHQGALAEIVQHECRHDEGEPVDANRSTAEMSHIGV
jgi:hypothetical protein